jgi:uncharacterized protein (TIGR02145 family)
MKNRIWTFHLILLGFVLMYCFGCKKDNPIELPVLTTQPLIDITLNSAKSGGNITIDGGDDIISRGLVWSSITNPSLEQHIGITAEGAGKGVFTSKMENLTSNTVYYLRAYATNSAGIAYGNEISFTTLAVQIPEIITTDVNSITLTSANSGGNITTDGGDQIISRGLVWNTTVNASMEQHTGITTEGSGKGIFTSKMENLTPNTMYFIRAYATNSAGIAYGTEISFTTLAVQIPEVTTSDVKGITQTTASSGGNVIFNGGASVTEYGICWGTDSVPTISDSKTIDGSGEGIFTGELTGLNAGTEYFVRAYATNSSGTGYGKAISFRTDDKIETVTDIDGNIYHTITIGDKVWMAENLKTTRFNDGTPIPFITGTIEWSNNLTIAFSIFNNEISYADTFGRLYNWNCVNEKHLPPKGWHVASDEEWSALIDFYGGEAIAGSKLKESGTEHWTSPNAFANNESGFTALPGGCRFYSGSFYGINDNGYYWTSTQSPNPTYAWFRKISYNSSGVIRDDDPKRNGYSVRCVKD